MKYKRPQPVSISFTKEGYAKVKNEHETLLATRQDAVVNLRTAREMGDLSENGYYHAAKARLTSLDSRLRHLKKLLLLGKVVEKTGSESIGLGSKVVVDDGEKEIKYEIVGGFESDPNSGKISTFSPLGKALVGKREGESVMVQIPAGQKKYKIINVL